MPTDSNSMQKKVAVKGVPKRPANTALMPDMIITRRSFSSSRKIFASMDATLPPSCNAAPSRPAEPPKRWVVAVARKMEGATMGETALPSSTASMISLVPRLPVILNSR